MTVKKRNYICKYNNLPTTCFGLIRPFSGWNAVSEENYLSDLNAGVQGRGREIVPSPEHPHLDQTDNFPLTLYSNLKMAELGRNM